MLPVISLYLWLACLFIFILRTSAQDDENDRCVGNTSTYTSNNLTIPFTNLCGKDISAKVDFLDPTYESSWSACMGRCVKKEPLCYGFDFRPLGSVDFENCWLLNATFDADTATYPGYVVDAAMLPHEFVEGLDGECKTLGLWGCWLKNGRVEQGTASSNSSSSAPSATATPDSTEPTGLSNGAKGGIVAGIVVTMTVVVLLITFVCIRRRKQRARGYAPGESVAEVSAHHQIVELLAYKGSYSTAEFPCPRAVHELDGSQAEKVPVPIGELVGSSPVKHQWREVGADARTHVD